MLDESAGQTVPVGRVRARRWRARRTALFLLISGATLCLFVIWQRDQRAIQSYRAQLHSVVAALQGNVDVWGRLPAAAPRHPQLRYTYISDAGRRYAKGASEPVVIAYTSKVPLILRVDGRFVIIWDKGKVRGEWMTLSEFRSAWLKQERRIDAFEQKLRQRPPDLP